MRAIQLTMRAFGPYKEKQVVDFTQLGEETLFLITGPTGAGKTTIFDAMCFALYGKANGDDRDHDTLRSHFASVEDHTEVSFQFTLHQKEFLIVRSPKQLKSKARGDGFTEQPPTAELYELINSEKQLLYGKVKEVNEAIEDMLQLDYEQFRKMVMIPQGEFRRLISENSKEREEILQKIFRTYFYDKITKKLVEVSKTLQQEIEQIITQENQEIQQVNWPIDYDVDQVTTDEAKDDLSKLINQDKKLLSERETNLAKQKKKLNEAQKKYYEAKELVNQFKEFEEQNEKLHQLDEQKDSIEADKSLLKNAKAAQSLVPFEKQVTQRNKEYEEISFTLQDQDNQFKVANSNFNVISQRYEELKIEEPLREEQKELIRKLKEEFEKHKQIASLSKDLQELQYTYKQHSEKVKNEEESVQSMDKQIQEMEHELENVQAVTEQFYEIKAKVQQFEELVLKGKQLKEELQKLGQYRLEYKQMKVKYDEAEQKVNEYKEQLKRLEDSQKQEQAAVFASSISEGEACPVCGSIHHPNLAQFHSNSVKDEDIDKTRTLLEQQETIFKGLLDQLVEIKSKGQSQKNFVDNIIENLMTQSNLTITTENMETRLNEWTHELDGIRNNKEHLNRQMVTLKEKTEVQKKIKMDVISKREELQQKLQALQEMKEEIVKITSFKEQLTSEIKYFKGDFTSFQNQLEETEKQYKDKVDAWEKIKQQYEQGKELKNNLQIQVHNLNEQLKKAQSILHQVKEEFIDEIKKKQFDNMEEYQIAKMDEEQQINLEQKIKTYEDLLSISKNRIEKLKEILKDQNRPDMVVIEQVVKDMEKIVDEEANTIQEQKLILERHVSILERLKTLNSKKREVEAEYFDMGELAKLARGDNPLRLSFERYVLSSFLDEILFQANIRLDQMTDHRYQLRRSDKAAKRGAQSGLDLEVIDYYTGQERSVKTLSGGEGFKAALSLALGMADVVQAHSGGVELDTLFIDEGFGTLDEISLEQALNCLSDLQKGNRMLGIISHVPKLKEEIRAQLQIETSQIGSKVSLSIS